MSSCLVDTTRQLYSPGFIICTIIPVSWGSGFKFHKCGVVWRSFFSASLSFRLDKQYSWYELDWLKRGASTESTASQCRAKWRVPLRCWVVRSISPFYYTVQGDSNFRAVDEILQSQWMCDRRRSRSKLLWYMSYFQLGVCNVWNTLSRVYVKLSISYHHIKKEHLRVVQVVIRS